MRLVTKLENRFNVALEKLELDTGASADSGELEALSKRVSDLKAAQAEKDATIAKLTSQVADLEKTSADVAEKDAGETAINAEKDAKITALTTQITDFRNLNEAATVRITGLKQSVASEQETNTKKQAIVEAAQAAERAAVNKITTLQDKLEKATTDATDSDDTLTKIEDLEDEVEGLNERVNIAEANAGKHYEKMRNLRGAHRVVRKNLKGNVLNAEEVNTAMEAELEALQMQREIDLNEVNIVLEKLTPLVEGK